MYCLDTDWCKNICTRRKSKYHRFFPYYFTPNKQIQIVTRFDHYLDFRLVKCIIIVDPSVHIRNNWYVYDDGKRRKRKVCSVSHLQLPCSLSHFLVLRCISKCYTSCLHDTSRFQTQSLLRLLFPISDIFICFCLRFLYFRKWDFLFKLRLFENEWRLSSWPEGVAGLHDFYKHERSVNNLP